MFKNNSGLILYELNEVPRKLYDFYIKKNPSSSFAFFKEKGLVFDTFTRDEGELHPWSTWPTVHRGVYNNQHQIKFINQDLTSSSKFKPIWQILSENKIYTGVFGSLQSYPPLENPYIKFYLPDTFSPDSKASSEILRLFQSFNLLMASDNKAKSRNINKKQLKVFYKLFLSRTLSSNTIFSIINQLIREKINAKNKARRSLIQDIMAFDLFYKTLNKTRPIFCTYFTNHVAGMMHRYWKDLFPYEFGLTKHKYDPFHAKSIIRAMDIANNDLAKLIKFSKSNNYDLWVISSMGQQAINRGEYLPELYLNDFQKFLLFLKRNNNNFKLLPAMQPDYCIECSTSEDLNLLRNYLKCIKDFNGKQIIFERYPPVNNRLNICLKDSKDTFLRKKVMFNDIELPIEDLGFEFIKRDMGTGYHIPEGIFLALGGNNKRLDRYQKQIIETSRICPTILDIFNVKIPDYMNAAL